MTLQQPNRLDICFVLIFLSPFISIYTIYKFYLSTYISIYVTISLRQILVLFIYQISIYFIISLHTISISFYLNTCGTTLASFPLFSNIICFKNCKLTSARFKLGLSEFKAATLTPTPQRSKYPSLSISRLNEVQS